MSTQIDVNVDVPGSVSIDLTAFLGDLYTLRSFGAHMNASFNSTPNTFSGTDDTYYVNELCNAQGSVIAAPQGASADYDVTGVNASNTTQGTVELPRGAKLLINGTISLPPGVRLRGNGAVLIRTDTTNTPMISCAYNQKVLPGPPGDHYYGNSGNIIEDLTLWGPGTDSSLGAGIQMINCQGFQINNVLIAGFYVGLDLQRCQYSKLAFVNTQYNVHGLIMRGIDDSNDPCIDMSARDCRFAKTVGGYGIWLQNATNISFDQVDANYSGKAALVGGGALPDHLGRIQTVATPGDGYLPSRTFPLVFQESGQTNAGQLSGVAQSDANGTIIAAWVTDGIGDGSGIATSGLTITVGTIPVGATSGLTPSTPARITPNIQRDATTFANWISTGVKNLDTGVTAPPQLQCGLIRIDNLKVEVASSPDGSDSIGAPDSGYLVFLSASASVNMSHFKIGDYGRSAANWFRWVYCAGVGSSISFEEFAPQYDSVPNPANPSDVGLVRAVNDIEIAFPYGTDASVFQNRIIKPYGTTALDGSVYVETTAGDTKFVSGLGIVNDAFYINTLFSIRNSGDTRPRFASDGSGTLAWGTGGSAEPDTQLGRLDAGLLILSNNVFAPGYQSIQTLQSSGNLADFVDTVLVHNGTLTLVNPSYEGGDTARRTVRVYCWFQTESITISGTIYTAAATSGTSTITVNQGQSVLLQYAGGGNWIQIG